MLPTLSARTSSQILSFIAADDHDDSDEDFNDLVTTLNREESSEAMELLQMELDRARATNHSQFGKRSKRFLPPSMVLDGLVCESKRAVKGGGFADVYVGRWNNRRVCMKVLRYFQEGSERETLLKALSKEVLLWRQLNHPNILPFLGKHPLDLDMKLKHAAQVAEGLVYLHGLDPPVAHGDIKGANILVSDDRRSCCLADFGLSVLDTQSMNPTKTASTQGSLRWLAPEFINPPSYTVAGAGMLLPRDIYAFGCLGGERPSLPAETIPRESAFKSMHSVLERCWSEKNSERPSAQRILELITNPQDLSLLGSVQVSKNTNEEQRGVVATGFVHGPARSASQRSFPFDSPQQQQSDPSSPHILTASLHNPEALPSIVTAAPQIRPPEPSSNEVSVDALDFDQPSTLEMYSKILLFKNDHTRNTLVSPTPTTQQYQVVQSIAQKLGLYHYFVGEGDEMCAVVARADPQRQQAPRESLPGPSSTKTVSPTKDTSLSSFEHLSVLEEAQISPPEAPSGEVLIDELDFNQPSTLKMYSKVLLFKNDLTRTELVCSTPTPQEYHVVKLIAQKLGLYQYSVGKRSTIVTRLDDTQLALLESATSMAYANHFHGDALAGSFPVSSYSSYSSSIVHQPAGVIERDSLPWDDPLLNQAWRDYQERVGQ
ncbi:kinase-like domain-containing protein [Rhodocollybia butyracea]|uniref:Kinase-like domain-containing protein n=1 Tax=Rhodocollybia butyracea TaxID=206335 RepID=A0A9P5PTX5_9AGAR|nr:kinase-like domain-containing protein [Rhodocollybia butyracea]